MRQLSQFLKFVVTRQMLGFVFFLCAALLIWFVGDDLAVGGLRPLAGDAARIACAALLALLAVLWLVSGPLSLVAMAGVMLLIWQAGPFLSFGDARPLGPSWVRIVIVGALASGGALYWLYRLLAAMRANDEFLAGILAFGQRRGGEDVAKEELKDVGSTVRRAIAQLRLLRTRGGSWERIIDGKRYLYELPWYLVVGSPGAGKSTALRNAGLQFPVSARTDLLPRGTRFGSDSGTLHCDWWLSNEAVLIDTAGRYATHESDPVKDPSEWRGFLGLLRKYRTRAPINGAIVVLSIAEVLRMTPAQRAAHAVQLRERLMELRQQLGIRFPVYLIVTKMDVLRGFTAYFQSLTGDARAQPWGLTLPFRDCDVDPIDAGTDGKALPDDIGTGLRLLKDRLAEGLRARMSEEFDTERRRALFALPSEFESAVSAIREVLDPMFLDSRFDLTQSASMLRGIYFTSAAQGDVEIPADPLTLVQRLLRTVSGRGSDALHDRPGVAPDLRPSPGGQGFFLQDVLKKAIFPEAHLVRPNLRWEARYRALHLLGHAAAIGAFVCLAAGLSASYANNRGYLRAIEQRTDSLVARVGAALAGSALEDVPGLLEAARVLPDQPGLDTGRPPLPFTYGLYSAGPPAQAASRTYADLQATFLLPPVLRRMERVLAQSIASGDSRTAFETLRVYKLLHDRKHYVDAGGAVSVREWVRRDAQAIADAARRGERDDTGMADLAAGRQAASHFDALFARDRVVQAPSLPDEALMRAAQGLLDGDTVTRRIYERAKAEMASDAPPDFTLVRGVGPQVGTVFTRKDGLPVDKGVPGLFTYDGYHRVFAPRVAAFVKAALEDDAWVMGRGNASVAVEGTRGSDAWLAHVREQYLTEYAWRWDDFLASVRTVGFVDATADARTDSAKQGGNAADRRGEVWTASSSLGFDLSVLRQLASPDSPLSRLARAAVHETTLARPRSQPTEGKPGLFDQAAAALAGKAAVDTEGAAVDDRAEKGIVDNHFAALREVVTGNPDASDASDSSAATDASGRAAAPGRGASAVPGGRPGLDAITGLLNDFYTWMVVADTALSAGGLPPGAADAGARLRLEAGRLPAPFKEILSGVAASSGTKVMQGATEILRRQAQLQVDRIMALMAVQVSEPCRRGLDGRYPFVEVAQDASIEDFTLVFAAGGALDEFFSRHLAPLVDTSARPWRYRSPDSAAIQAPLDVVAGSVPTIAVPGAPTGPTLLGETLRLLAREGPNLEPFYRAQQIRNVFFREPGGKRMAWKMDLTVRELEPSITELLMDIDGQSQRYVHGPLQALSVAWPGPRGGAMAELTAQPRISAATSTLSSQGPWALFRLVDKGRVIESATPGRLGVEYLFDGRRALIELGTGSQSNPLNSDLLKGFRCPGRTS